MRIEIEIEGTERDGAFIRGNAKKGRIDEPRPD